MQFNKKYINLSSILICSLPLSIATIIIGATGPGTCDNIDIMNLNTSQWLIGLGISSLIFIVAYVCLSLIIIFPYDTRLTICSVSCRIILSICHSLFGTAWIIIGGIILFRSQLDCINEGSITVIYGLVMWCISVFDCCIKCRFIADNDNDNSNNN